MSESKSLVMLNNVQCPHLFRHLLAYGSFWHGSSMIFRCIFCVPLCMLWLQSLAINLKYLFFSFRLQIETDFLAYWVLIQLLFIPLYYVDLFLNTIFFCVRVWLELDGRFPPLYSKCYSMCYCFSFQLNVAIDFVCFTFSMKKYRSNWCQIHRLHSTTIHIECAT